jgi:bifunctional UDP-N-acetylglucosamine pyrophosphorylase/glucosamine-1-phosphate N-acetyltransferase
MAQTPLLILLASDDSTRMWPLRDIPLMRFGTEPLLLNQLQRFQSLGFEYAVIVASPHNRSEITSYVENLRIMQCRVVVQPEPKGIGDALLQAAQALSSDLSRPVYIARAAEVVDISLHRILLSAFNSDSGFNYVAGLDPSATAELRRTTTGELRRVSATGELRATVPPLVHLHNDGSRLIHTLRQEAERSPETAYVRVLEGLRKNNMIRTVPYKGFFGSLDFPWQVLDMMNYFLSQIQGQIVAGNAFVSDKASLIGDVFIGAGARVFPGATINGPAYIGANTFIANNALVRNSMILSNCEVGFTAEVARSYVGDNCSLHAARVLDSVFAGGITFSAGCTTANLRLDRAIVSTMVDGQRRDTGKRKLGAIVGRDTAMAINTMTMPGVKIGEHCRIGPGTLLRQDVADNKRVYVKQEIVISEERGK